jgi:integrase
MAIEKRISKKTGVTSYRVRLRLREGGEYSSTHARLTDARDSEAQMLSALRSGQRASQIEARQHTFDEVVEKYLALLPSLKLKDARNRRRHVEWWRHELKGVHLSALTPARIRAACDRLQSTPITPQRTKKPPPKGPPPPRWRSAATIVRYLAALSHMLGIAADDWGWLESNPVRKVRKPKQPPGRVRYLAEAERVRLLAACHESTSHALLPVVVMALATGMRKSEILTLRWSQVDLEAGLVTLTETKNGERRQVPLVGRAWEEMKIWSKAGRNPGDYVFPSGKPDRPRDITQAWRTAAAKAELTDFHFHDLRHTTASYLAMGSASLLEIGDVLGHKSTQMTKRYAHLSVAHTRKVLTGMVDAMFPAAAPSVQAAAAASEGVIAQ